MAPSAPSPASKPSGCAVIIATGGGHIQLTIDREGYDLAQFLAARGIAAYVLKSHLGPAGPTIFALPASPNFTNQRPLGDEAK